MPGPSAAQIEWPPVPLRTGVRTGWDTPHTMELCELLGWIVEDRRCVKPLPFTQASVGFICGRERSWYCSMRLRRRVVVSD